MRTALRTTIVLVLLALVIGGVRVAQPERHHLTADFSRTISLYAGAKVKVLGVDVGTVDHLQVVGDRVRADISYDASVPLPADVHAMIVPPSIVGDRFVQLAPAYRSGPVLADGATLGEERTGVPLELDDTFKGLDRLVNALGPRGANRDGALSRLVRAAAAGLSGNGRRLNTTIRSLTDAIGTLADSSGPAGDTVTHLAAISGTLAGNDRQLRTVVTVLAQVATQLNHQGTRISGAVTGLQAALRLVKRFVRTHRRATVATLRDLRGVSGQLAGRSADLDRLIKLTPVGLSSLLAIYQPKGWDVQHPGRTPLAARIGSQALRGDLLEDLDNQLGFTLGAVCADLPAGTRTQLQPLCSALNSTGNNLGAVLGGLVGNGAGLPTGPTDLAGLLGGPR